MEVREFVATTLQQIVQGVSDAQEAAAALGGAVNPTPKNLLPDDVRRVGTTANGQAVFAVEFDVAVTASAEASSEGGAKIEVASIFSLGGKGAGSEQNSTTSRVRFLVPITLPVEQVSSAAVAKERSAKAKTISYPHTGAI